MKRHDFLATWSSRTGAGWLSPAVDIVRFFALGDKLFCRFARSYAGAHSFSASSAMPIFDSR